MKSDNVHYTSAGYIKLGQDFAKAMRDTGESIAGVKPVGNINPHKKSGLLSKDARFRLLKDTFTSSYGFYPRIGYIQ